MSDLWTGPSLRRGREAIAEVLDRNTSPEGVRKLIALPAATRLKVFEEVAGTASGAERLRLAEVAALTDVTKQAERLTRSTRASSRVRGVRILSLTGAAHKKILRLLYDRMPEVRIEAARWAADHPEPAVVWGLLEMLNDSDEACRTAARESLKKLGSVTVEALDRALTRIRRPFKERGLVGVLEVAASVGDPRLVETVIAFCDHTSPAVRESAVRALGAMGGSLVGGVVDRLLKDEDARVRTAAATATGRIGRWRSSARLADLLGDSDEDVRAAAAVALKALGAPGVLMLRRHNAVMSLHSVN
jgi:hypothetical protein